MRVLLVFLTVLALRGAAQSTCTDLQRLASRASGITCTRNSQCSELQCDVTRSTIRTYIRRATLTLLPCNQPAAVRLVLYNPSNAVIVNRTFDSTATLTVVNGVLTVMVTVEHPTSSSLRLGISGTVRLLFSQSLQILPNTDIALNTSACLSATTAPTVVTSAATTAAGSQATTAPSLSGTCQALDTLRDNAQSLSCNRNDQCDTVYCTVTDSTVRAFVSAANLTLLPCNQPPAVRLTAYNPSGGVVLDRVISQSETLSLPQGTTLSVTLNQLTNAIGFGASASATVFGLTSSTTLVPYTQIPIDTSGCSTSNSSSNAITNTPTITPTVDIPQRNMCIVLEQIASRAPGNFECSTNQRCDGVDCTGDLLNNGMPFQSHAVILVCQLPRPAVEIILLGSSGAAIVNETVDHSEVLSVQQLLQVNITLDQLQNAIGLQVEATFLNNPPAPVIEYTLIPIDTSNCQRPTLGIGGTETDQTTTDDDDGRVEAASAGNPLIAGATVLFLSLLGSGLCTP